MTTKITFNCDNCGKEVTTWLNQYNRAKNHFCSNTCNGEHRRKNVDRKAYERDYWSRPENFARRKKAAKAASTRRLSEMGDSLKKSMVSRAKQRSTNSNIPFDITYEDFDVPSVCPALGIPLTLHNKQGGCANSPSLDRIHPEKGYTKGNVCIISKRANSIKSDATWEEVQAVADFMKKFCRLENPPASDPPCTEHELTPEASLSIFLPTKNHNSQQSHHTS